MSSWEATGKTDEWYTPKYIFDALGCTFDMDVAAAPGGCNVPATYFERHKGLEVNWRGFVWMNPPFGGRNGLIPWLDKFFDHGNGIALVPDRTSAPWFQTYAPKAVGLLFIAPKVKFQRPDGSLGKSPGCGTVLMAAGTQGWQALKRGRKLGFLTLPA